MHCFVNQDPLALPEPGMPVDALLGPDAPQRCPFGFRDSLVLATADHAGKAGRFELSRSSRSPREEKSPTNICWMHFGVTTRKHGWCICTAAARSVDA